MYRSILIASLLLSSNLAYALNEAECPSRIRVEVFETVAHTPANDGRNGAFVFTKFDAWFDFDEFHDNTSSSDKCVYRIDRKAAANATAVVIDRTTGKVKATEAVAAENLPDARLFVSGKLRSVRINAELNANAAISNVPAAFQEDSFADQNGLTTGRVIDLRSASSTVSAITLARAYHHENRINIRLDSRVGHSAVKFTIVK